MERSHERCHLLLQRQKHVLRIDVDASVSERTVDVQAGRRGARVGVLDIGIGVDHDELACRRRPDQVVVARSEELSGPVDDVVAVEIVEGVDRPHAIPHTGR